MGEVGLFKKRSGTQLSYIVPVTSWLSNSHFLTLVKEQRLPFSNMPKRLFVTEWIVHLATSAFQFNIVFRNLSTQKSHSEPVHRLHNVL